MSTFTKGDVVKVVNARPDHVAAEIYNNGAVGTIDSDAQQCEEKGPYYRVRFLDDIWWIYEFELKKTSRLFPAKITEDFV